MFESRLDEQVARPTVCPFCKSKAVDTLGRIFTVKTLWRCRQCEETWTIASVAASLPRPR